MSYLVFGILLPNIIFYLGCYLGDTVLWLKLPKCILPKYKNLPNTQNPNTYPNT